jgi:hypothetical protein
MSSVAVTLVMSTCKEVKKKVKQSLYRPGQALLAQRGGGFQISRQSAHEGGIFQPYVQASFTTRKYSSFPVVQTGIYSLLMVLAFIIFLASNCQYYVRKDYSDGKSMGSPRGGGVPGCSPPSEICSHDDIKGFYVIYA